MNNRYFLIFLGFGVGLASAAEVVRVPDLADRYKQTRERVAELFRYRNGNPPTPDSPVNLFRVAPYTTSLPDLPTPSTKIEERPPADEVVLRLAVATLKGGTLTVGGRAYLTLNKQRYEEGATIVVRVRDRPVALVLRKLVQNNATFSYNDAEIVVKF